MQHDFTIKETFILKQATDMTWSGSGFVTFLLQGEFPTTDPSIYKEINYIKTMSLHEV